MSTTPDVQVDLSPPGAGANVLVLRIYDEATGHRISVDVGSIGGQGITVPSSALAAFQAAVAGLT